MRTDLAQSAPSGWRAHLEALDENRPGAVRADGGRTSRGPRRAPTRPRRRRRPDAPGVLDRSANWIIGVAAVVAAATLLYVGRRSSFFWDEWWFIVRRRDGSLDDFFRPWNGHLIAIPVLIYKALFELVGLRHYLPYRVVLTAAHVGTCVLLFAYLRRRVTVVYALATTIVILFLGVAWEDLLWPFQITYIFSLAGGLGALYLLDRRHAPRRHRRGARARRVAVQLRARAAVRRRTARRAAVEPARPPTDSGSCSSRSRATASGTCSTPRRRAR